MKMGSSQVYEEMVGPTIIVHCFFQQTIHDHSYKLHGRSQQDSEVQGASMVNQFGETAARAKVKMMLKSREEGHTLEVE
jgi:hypothetical protein